MSDIFEYCLILSESTLEAERGWITPSGKFQPIEAQDHREDAVRILVSQGELENKRLPTYWYKWFGEKTGYIRVDINSEFDEVVIDILPPQVTKSQMKLIGKLSRDYPNFTWEVMADDVWGKDLRSLRSHLIKTGRLQ